MNELPENRLTVSEARADGNTVFLRLLHNYSVDSDGFGTAYDVVLKDCTDVDQLLSTLATSETDGDWVWVRISGHTVSVIPDYNDEIDCTFTDIAVARAELNDEELRGLIKGLRESSNREHSTLIEARSRLSASRTKILQQLERLEAKAISHSDTTAGTLYRQQIEFLNKLLEAVGR